MNEPRLPANPGETLYERYRIVGRLGQGGMGVVMEAQDLKLGRSVAIKLLGEYHALEGVEAASLANDRAQNEAIAIASVKSDHVVQVFDVGQDGRGACYIVMERLEGSNLAELIARTAGEGRQVPVSDAVRWVVEACEGLAQVQQRGIVHRDVKLSNLFLEKRPDGSERVKLLDFGIAKLPGKLRVSVPTLTQEGHFVGSPVYSAPEQLTDARNVDVRADIWSLGVALYELLTQRRPFRAESEDALRRAIVEEPHPSVHQLRADLPDALCRVIDRCLEKRRDARWQELDQLALALAPFAPPESQKLALRISNLVSQAPNRFERMSPITRERPPMEEPPSATAEAISSGSTSRAKRGALRPLGVLALLVTAVGALVWLLPALASLTRHDPPSSPTTAVAAPVPALPPRAAAQVDPGREPTLDWIEGEGGSSAKPPPAIEARSAAPKAARMKGGQAAHVARQRATRPTPPAATPGGKIVIAPNTERAQVWHTDPFGGSSAPARDSKAPSSKKVTEPRRSTPSAGRD